METLEEVLEHHGIKGMKWGVRRKRGADGRVDASPDAARAHEYHTTARTKGSHALTNQELQHLVTRMNLEQQYSRLAGESPGKARIKKGQKAAKGILGAAKTGQEVYRLANSPEVKALRKALAK